MYGSITHRDRSGYSHKHHWDIHDSRTYTWPKKRTLCAQHDYFHAHTLSTGVVTISDV